MMWLRVWFCIMIGFWLSSRATSEIPYVISQALPEVAELANDLEKTFPSKSHHYVIIGRSLSLLGAYWEAKGVSVSHIPMSRFREIKVFESDGPYGRSFAPFDDDLEARRKNLREHLAHYLAFEDSSKTLVVLDYIQKASSLWAAVEGIKNVLEVKNEVKVVAISNSRTSMDWFDDLSWAHVFEIDRSGTFSDAVQYQQHDSFGKFGSCDLRSISEDKCLGIAPSTKYLNLIKDLQIKFAES